MTTTETDPTTSAPDGRPAPSSGAATGDAPAAARAPAREPGRPRRYGWWLAAIALAGLALRLVYLLGWRTPWPVLGDPYYYHHGANLLADGEGYVHPYRFLLYGVRMPGADHPPGYLTALAGFSWLGLRSFFQHQVISCVMGALGVAALGLAGRRVAGERVGLIAAAMAALSPNLFYFDAMVVSETLVVSTTALLLLAAYRWWDRPGAGSAALFGAAVGVAALVRSEAILLGPLIAVPLVLWRRRAAAPGDAAGRSWRRGAGQLALAGAVAGALIAPWVAHNMARFEEPTTLSAQFDQTLGTANCEEVYYGDRVGYWSLACIQATEHLVGDGDASAQGRGFARIARRYMRDHTERVPFVVAARVGRTFAVYQPQEQMFLDTEIETKEPVLGEIGLGVWYGVAVAGAFGLVGLRRAGRPVFPLVAVCVSVVATVAVVYGNTRFRLPAELALMIPAAVSLDGAWTAFRRRRGRELEPSLRPADPPVGADPADGAAPAPEAPAGDGPAGVGVPAAAGPAVDAAADPPGGLGSSSGRFAGFDGMRAIAALGVLVTHVSLQVGFVVRDRTGNYLS
ncbi:MAG TPA: glycosyltransferase family 39 protein, partial [Acidimicrobiales bacterium]|nr:glycosyltransferase family 39 protein [Acidimicrobiales bacterium]